MHHAGSTHSGFAESRLNDLGDPGVKGDVAAPFGDGLAGVNLLRILKCAAPARVADAFAPGAGNQKDAIAFRILQRNTVLL